MKNQLVKLLVSIVFIVVALFVVDRGLGQVMWWVNQHTHDVSGPKIKYLVNDANEDLIFFGASRCNMHYVPSIISDSLKMTVYNGGINSSENILSHYVIFCHVLAHHTPKVVCLEVMAHDFMKEDKPFTKISFFAPYVGINDRVDSVYKEAGEYTFYMLSHLYRYNAKAISNIAGLKVDKHEDGDRGYISYPQPDYVIDKLEDEHTPEMEEVKLKYMRKFIELCREKKINLIFVTSPKYTVPDSNLYDVVKDIAKSYGIEYLDYHTSGLFRDHPEFFKDSRHLWDKGARMYSSIFASDLKRILNN